MVCLLSVSSTVSGCKDRRSCFPTGLKMAIDGGDPGGQWRNFTWERFSQREAVKDSYSAVYVEACQLQGNVAFVSPGLKERDNFI